MAQWYATGGTNPRTRWLKVPHCWLKRSAVLILNRCHDNGWIQTKFWNHIKVRINTELMEAADDKEIGTLLSLLDKTKYSGFRDSVAILLMYKTGIRIKTLGLLEEK